MIDIDLPIELKQLVNISPGTVFVYDGEVYEKSAETDPDGDILVVKLSDGTIHRYSDCTVSEIDVTLIKSNKRQRTMNTPTFRSHSINYCKKFSIKSNYL